MTAYYDRNRWTQLYILSTAAPFSNPKSSTIYRTTSPKPKLQDFAMSDPSFYIETARLYISYFLPTSPAHCSFLVELYNSPLFLAAEGKTGIYTDLQAKERIQTRFLAEHARNGHGTYLVSLKTTPTTSFAESRPIGSVSLVKGNTIAAPDIGYSIIPEMNGKGTRRRVARRC